MLEKSKMLDSSSSLHGMINGKYNFSLSKKKADRITPYSYRKTVKVSL